MLGAISARLGRDKVGAQFTPRLALLLCLAHGERTVSGLADLCGFDAAIAGEDLELLRGHHLAHRSREGTWRLCCASLAPGVERLVDVVLTQKEAT